MNETVQRVIGVTLILVALYLMLNNANGTNSIIQSLAEGYGDVVRALQAR